MEIILVRHGKPISASNKKLDAQGFALWIGEYDQSKIDASCYPPNELLNLCINSHIISSALPRAIHSAEMASKQIPSEKIDLLNEMQLPSFFLPFKMRISYWLFVNRVLWLLGFSANVESYQQAKIRACLMAKELVNLATVNKRLVVFGHGLMNRQISKELVKLGWQSNRQGGSYWSTNKLTKN
ncbi:MAG: histidine phosphatase family protein [Psychromonas sp.]|nr:histidine phosphatase family protein [Psychromonas sp.]